MTHTVVADTSLSVNYDGFSLQDMYIIDKDSLEGVLFENKDVRFSSP